MIPAVNRSKTPMEGIASTRKIQNGWDIDNQKDMGANSITLAEVSETKKPMIEVFLTFQRSQKSCDLIIAQRKI